MPAEARTLGLRRVAVGQGREVSGARVVIAGIGPSRAAAAAQRLRREGVAALLSWGVAGGVAAGLRPGALLVPSLLMTEDAPPLSVDPAWQARLVQALSVLGPVDQSPLHSRAAPLAATDDKRALAAQGIGAVDMESAAVARVAAAAGLPFAAVKTVCDPADRALPPALPGLLDERGRLRAGGLRDALAGGPRLWRQLDRLRRDYAAARRALAAAAPLALRILPG